MRPPTLILAGGGTGGHVYPLLAVADVLRSAAPNVELVFVGTARGLEARVIPPKGYPLELVRVLPLRGGGWAGALRGVSRASFAVGECWTLLRRIEPRAVLSIGGYAAGPLTLAARLRGVPVALIEPNARIGLTNRLIAPWVQRAYTAFTEVERHFRSGRVLRTGVPIREGFAAEPLGPRAECLRVLVLGGSQGAEFLNRQLPAALHQAKTPISVLHQSGPDRSGEVRERYHQLGFGERACVVPFIQDMPSALGRAELVVGRSGASAVAEICAVGRPSLLVPYPLAAADHQLHNARSLERGGASVCITQDEATSPRLAAVIDRLASAPGLLQRMAERALDAGRPRAALTIACDLLVLARLPRAPAAELCSSGQGAVDSRAPYRLGEVG
jgi:UDP-N-acetylglucosamine--N-acetylmuramyl-(pentapeptide) pyrophosphoryl-undecaprenol N-acetylglucosamine transferase